MLLYGKRNIKTRAVLQGWSFLIYFLITVCKLSPEHGLIRIWLYLYERHAVTECKGPRFWSFMSLLNDIVIQIKINQFKRCQIGSEVFGSLISIRHAKSLYILAKFIIKDGTVNCY